MALAGEGVDQVQGPKLAATAAAATAPLEFARLVLARLKVFSREALDAWYGLYTIRDPARYFALVRALGIGAGPAASPPDVPAPGYA